MSPDVCCFWYPPHFKRLTIFINLYNQETSFHWKHWWEVGRLFPWKFSATVIAYWVHTLSGTLTLMPLWQPCEWKDLHPQDIKWKCYLVNRVYLQPHGLCSPPGSSVHEILQARTLEWVTIFLLQGIFLTQGSNPHPFCLLHWQAGTLKRLRKIKWQTQYHKLSTHRLWNQLRQGFHPTVNNHTLSSIYCL